MKMSPNEAVIIMENNVYTLFDGLSFLASIASLILAVLAIWLSIVFKRDSDKVNRETSELLVKIKTESESISKVVLNELKAYGDSMRGTIANNSSSTIPTATVATTDFNVANNKSDSAEP
jgi:hypothetical protein